MVFLLSADGEHLELPQGCQGAFRGSGRNVGFLSRPNSGKGPQLALRGESPGFSQVAAANLGFLSNYDWELRDTFVGPQEIPVSLCVVSGLSGFLCSRSQVRGPHLELRPERQGSSPEPTWISGFLWSFNRGVRSRVVWRHEVRSLRELAKQCKAS